MSDAIPTHTYEHAIKELEADARTAHDNNMKLCHELREIKKTRWYRIGRFLRLVP